MNWHRLYLSYGWVLAFVPLGIAALIGELWR